VISLPESEGGHHRHQDRVQLGSLMTDACRSLHRDQRLREHDLLFREILLGLNHLGEIGDLDAAETVLTTKRDALAQALVRTDHATARHALGRVTLLGGNRHCHEALALMKLSLAVSPSHRPR
jgi:hypothetical protein